MTTYHHLLERQLRRAGIDVHAALPAPWASLLEQVDGTYAAADEGRDLLERSLAISSRELGRLNDDLARSSATELTSERDKLRAIMATQAALLEASPNGILMISPTRHVVVCNQRFADMWRVPAEVLATRDDYELLQTALLQLDDPATFMRKVDELSSNQTDSMEDELRLRDGTIIERMSTPVIDAAGVWCGRLWEFRDVSARRQADERSREAHAFVDSIVETIPAMVFVKGAERLQYVRLNRGFELQVGTPREQLLGKTDNDLFPAAQAAGFIAMDRQVLAQGGVSVVEELLETPNGTRHMRTRKTSIRNADGTPRYLVGISEDITEERQRDAELFLAKEQAERASRTQSDFLLNMSHELRTPLNAILGFARVLVRTTRERLTADEHAYLADIVHAGDHMLQLVNDLLDLRRLEAHDLDLAAVDVVLVCEEATRMIQPLVRAHRQVLTLAIDQVEASADEVAPLRCLGARREIVQALINLLTNASKFTPDDGRIDVTVVRDGSMLAIRVIDSGPGIAAADQARLFVYFEQLGDKHAHGMQGSGIGLALTRALVEKMGGTVGVTSSAGNGATFEIKLRVA